MQAVRRLSLPLVQPVARLFNRDERDPAPRLSIIEGSPAILGQEQTLAQAQATAELPSLDLITSNPVSSSTSADADLPLPLQDMLYQYQLGQAAPLKLSPIAFHTANIVWRIKDSEKVYSVLQKRGMITKDGEIRTAGISNKFAHQLAFLTAFAQRRVIGLLFWWEEEEQRLKHLYEQQADIEEALSKVDEDQDRSMVSLLKIELERTKMLIKQQPSDRYDDTASARRREQLPAYAPPPAGSSREWLPLYTEDPGTFARG